MANSTLYYHFTESAHTPAYNNDRGYLRSILPNTYYDSEKGVELTNSYLDDSEYAAKLGFGLMSNEQYSTATCGNISAILNLSVLARATENVPLLALGVTVGAHPDPIKVAEQIAWLDIVSNGRLEVGLVKGASALYPSTNVNPAISDTRFMEAFELIREALSQRETPFSWTGEHFEYRNVNIWPRPVTKEFKYWNTALGPFGAIQVARLGARIATTISTKLTKITYDAYLEENEKLGRTTTREDRGHMVYLAIAETKEAAEKKTRILLEDYYYRGQSVFSVDNLPGMKHFSAVAKGLNNLGRNIGGEFIESREGERISIFEAPMEEIARSGVCFAGTPEMIIEQIQEFQDYTGGAGHLILGMHGGTLSSELTRETMDLMKSEVIPHLD